MLNRAVEHVLTYCIKTWNMLLQVLKEHGMCYYILNSALEHVLVCCIGMWNMLLHIISEHQTCYYM